MLLNTNQHLLELANSQNQIIQLPLHSMEQEEGDDYWESDVAHKWYPIHLRLY